MAPVFRVISAMTEACVQRAESVEHGWQLLNWILKNVYDFKDERIREVVF